MQAFRESASTVPCETALPVDECSLDSANIRQALDILFAIMVVGNGRFCPGGTGSSGGPPWSLFASRGQCIDQSSIGNGGPKSLSKHISTNTRPVPQPLSYNRRREDSIQWKVNPSFPPSTRKLES